jgi:aspartyl protease family protein
LEVTLVGLAASKAGIAVGSGSPKTLTIGQQSSDGVRLVGIEEDSATIEIDGQRRTLRMGQAYNARPGAGPQKIVLSAGAGGHFYAAGQVNGGAIRFVVDTGATSIALPVSDARRLGINYLSAPRTMVQTANGNATAYRVKLDTVALGELSLNNVEALILEGGLTTPLLGMSFLSRTAMQNDGATLTLTKRY